MSYVNERKAIEKRLRDLHDSFQVPVQYENVAVLKQGTETLKDYNKTDKFIRLTITGSGAEQLDVGGSRDRSFGIITVQVFVKAGRGTNLARKIADEIKSIYNRKNFDGILCRTTEINDSGVNEDGWYQINVDTPFYRED
jgi:hypothetical protein